MSQRVQPDYLKNLQFTENSFSALTLRPQIDPGKAQFCFCCYCSCCFGPWLTDVVIKVAVLEDFSTVPQTVDTESIPPWKTSRSNENREHGRDAFFFPIFYFNKGFTSKFSSNKEAFESSKKTVSDSNNSTHTRLQWNTCEDLHSHNAFPDQRWEVFLLLVFETHISITFEYIVICIWHGWKKL